MKLKKPANAARVAWVTTISMVLVIAGGCSSTGTYRPESCPLPHAKVSDYLIGPGDTLQIVVWRSPELSAEIPVRPDGRISTPLVDDMVASGKTPSQLGADMKEVLSEFLRSPEVSVMVTQQGASNQIQVVGEVNVPQALSHREGMRVLDLIVAVGGLGEFAAGNRSRLIRESDGQQVECQVSVKNLMDGDMSQNILIYPGDVLVVPETRF